MAAVTLEVNNSGEVGRPRCATGEYDIVMGSAGSMGGPGDSATGARRQGRDDRSARE